MSDTGGRRYVRSGECLAVAPGYTHALGAEMWWDNGPPIPENQASAGTVQVFVRGLMEHHKGCGGDSYDGLLERFGLACATDARTIVLRVDSPGGVVSGLNECVAELSALAKYAGKRTVAFVDGMATSAAFALSCSCEEIVCPKSAILGSVGVISTMTSYVDANEARGVKIVTITSGECKSDGHLDSPITDNAIKRERARVEVFARQFFALASKARALDPDVLRGYQAGLFVGADAVRAGLADAVMPLRELLADPAGR